MRVELSLANWAWMLIQSSLNCRHHGEHVPFWSICDKLLGTIHLWLWRYSLNASISSSWFVSSWLNRASNIRSSVSRASSFRDCQSRMPSRADIYGSRFDSSVWSKEPNSTHLERCHRSVESAMIAFDHCNSLLLNKEYLQKTLFTLHLDECCNFTK